MDNKKESAISPVVAVAMILALTGVIVGIASMEVLSNVDNILINDVKTVGVTVQISGDDISVFPVSGKDLKYLGSYDVYFLGENDPIILGSSGSNDGYSVESASGSNPLAFRFNGVYDKGNVTHINIIGHFSDGTDAVIFTGRIDDGYVVVNSGSTGGDKDNKFKVTYDLNVGSGTVPTDSNEYNSGDTVSVKSGSGLTKERNTFKGWNTKADGSGTPYVEGDTFTITKNVNLYAIYSDITYKITYHDKNGNNNTALTQSYTYNTQVTIKGNTDGNYINNSNDGYFDGWNTEPNGSGKRYIEGYTFYITQDVNLYINWSNINPYFPYGTTRKNGGSYGTLKELIDGINAWSQESYGMEAVEVVGAYSNNNKKCTINIRHDIPLEDNPITLKSGWELTISNGDLTSTTSNGEYPSSRPQIWAAPTTDFLRSLFVLEGEDNDNRHDDVNTILNINSEIILDGDEHMKTSVIMVSPESTLNVNADLRIKNGNRGGEAITINGGGIFNAGNVYTTNGASIIIDNCKAKNGGGFYNSHYWSNSGSDNYDATADIKCEITNCYAVATYEKGKFIDGAGGAIYIHKSLTLKDGSLLENNHADLNGGGIFNYKSGTLIIEGNVNISGNDVIKDTNMGGGGIYNSGSIKVNDGDLLTIEGNSANSNSNGGGGGICNDDGGKINVNGGGEINIISNVAKENGGGIFSSSTAGIITNDGTINVKNNGKDVNGNIITKNGGGIYNDGSITVNNGGKMNVNSNIASESGGGIYNSGTITNSGGANYRNGEANIVINGNTANRGGGIYNDNAGTIINRRTNVKYPKIEIKDNKLSGGNTQGGAIYDATYKETTDWRGRTSRDSGISSWRNGNNYGINGSGNTDSQYYGNKFDINNDDDEDWLLNNGINFT